LAFETVTSTHLSSIILISMRCRSQDRTNFLLLNTP
jgi:hypothetical protein